MDKNIMIVDDDEELHTLYGLYLQGESFHITRAFNGKQALELLGCGCPDLIVLDMIMPEMDGESFLKEFYSRGKMKEVPIIIASVNDKIPEKLLKLANVRAILKKPFSVDTLINKVKELTC